MSTICNILKTDCQPMSPICQLPDKINKIKCEFCSKEFNTRQSKSKHKKKCKETNKFKEIEEQNKQLMQTINELKNQVALIINDKCEIHHKTLQKINNQKEENKKLKEELKNINLTKIKKDIDDIKNNINNPPINNQLINIISDKNKKIEELHNTKQIIQPIIEKHIQTFESLTLNNIVIKSRSDDNFINATQLCQAGNKKFNDWYRLDNTKKLVEELSFNAGIPVLKLIDIKKGNNINLNLGSWIHPELAIQLAQWISPKFAIQVSKWIIDLFSNGKVEINTNLVTDNKLKDQKIKLLEDTYLKKHKREDYPDKNVIYILSTVDHLKNRIYIVGKAKNLKNRLSTYNKTCDHQVIYYKKCINEETLNLVELNVLNKLKQYQEKANRDRFTLPIENDISLFINIVDNCINFFS